MTPRSVSHLMTLTAATICWRDNHTGVILPAECSPAPRTAQSSSKILIIPVYDTTMRVVPQRLLKCNLTIPASEINEVVFKSLAGLGNAPEVGCYQFDRDLCC